MSPRLLSIITGLLATLYFSGCATHEPLPRLEYRGAGTLGASSDGSKPSPVATTMSLEQGEAIGHSLTSYALMPGGYAMPIKSGPTSATAFNAEDQAAFVENLSRILTERGIIKLIGPDASPAAAIMVKFLKIEHFPNMQDYIIDALVTARAPEKNFEKVYHVSTIDEVNVVARMFQHAIDGRRRAAELLLAAVVPDLEPWFASPTSSVSTPAALFAAQPFDVSAPTIARFLRERYARPSTFWKDGISVRAIRPGANVAMIELRWSNSDTVPPFCVVDLYAAGDTTRISVRERNPLLSSRARVKEALEEYVRTIQSAGNKPSEPAQSSEPK